MNAPYFSVLLSGAILCLGTGCAQTSQSFLKPDQVANSIALLAPPPSFESAEFINDKAIYAQTRHLVGTARWKQAKDDADISNAHLGKLFSDAFGMDISPSNTPNTYALLIKLRTDSDHNATKRAKEHYQRIRPFAFFHNRSCTPIQQLGLSLIKNGSYPSGHASFGWAAALVLAEIRPERQNQILKRGYDIGQSRVICGMHWQSDVDAGRITGSAVVARLHADPNFIKSLDAAKREIQEKIQLEK